MRTALCALPSNPGQDDANLAGLDRALLTVHDCNLAVVAEAFGQGLGAITDVPDHDLAIAWSADGPEIARVRAMARKHDTAICCGFIERDGDTLHSSAIIVDRTGETLALYRRISPGWRSATADPFLYVDGTDPVCFQLEGLRITVALCGDLWDVPDKFAAVGADLVLWPVWTNYTPEFWDGGEREAYATQAAVVADRVMLVNSLANDRPDAPEWAGASWGGASYFEQRRVAAQLPMGQPGILVIDL